MLSIISLLLAVIIEVIALVLQIKNKIKLSHIFLWFAICFMALSNIFRILL